MSGDRRSPSPCARRWCSATGLSTSGSQLIHDLGFAVEIWDWTTKDLAALAGDRGPFTSMTGYVEGNLTDPDGADALLRTAEQSVAARGRLGTPNLNLHGTGLDGRGPARSARSTTVTGAMWLAAGRR